MLTIFNIFLSLVFNEILWRVCLGIVFKHVGITAQPSAAHVVIPSGNYTLDLIQEMLLGLRGVQLILIILLAGYTAPEVEDFWTTSITSFLSAALGVVASFGVVIVAAESKTPKLFIFLVRRFTSYAKRRKADESPS